MNAAKRRKSSESLASHASMSDRRSAERETVPDDVPSAPTPGGSPDFYLKKEHSVDRSRSQSVAMARQGSTSSKSSKSLSRGATASPATSGDAKEEPSDDEGQPKLSRRTSSQKMKPQLQLFNDYPDSTAEATSTFEVIKTCIYSNKAIGDSMQDGEVMSCECRPDWDGKENYACGENSDCINRMTNMECPPDDCGCGADCANQRFQRAQYADVSVIKTEKKGYGLRANTDLAPNTFLYEYVGEVIDETKFRRRTHKYAQDGIKHFYFMSLGKNEFVDATKKGGLGRFCNHSCNPNCYVDKWVVGEKLRMGIFAKRAVQAGEELVFDYNVDRYGADPQTCYCGEPNCLGYIGGKTQTDSAPKLSHHTLEALGLDDENWSTATARKARRRKTGEDDEDYVQNAQTKPLSEADVTKVMGSLAHCKERWLIYKLLSRIHSSDDEKVPARVFKLHGYHIFGRVLKEYCEDDELVVMILDIMLQFPRITRNKIMSSEIDKVVKSLASSSTNEQVKKQATAMVEIWDNLEIGFRIRRRENDGKDDENKERKRNAYEERGRRSRTRSKSPETTRPPTPTKPRGFNRPNFQTQPPRGPRADRDRKPPNEKRHNLPWGWHRKWLQERGKCYYYSNDGQTRWDPPLDPCQSDARLSQIPGPPPPPGQPPIDLNRAELSRIVESITRQSHADREEKARKAEAEKMEREKTEREERKRRKEKEAARRPKKTYDPEKTKHMLQKSYASVVPNMLLKYQEQLGGKEVLKTQAKEIVKILVEKSTRDGKVVPDPHLVATGDRRLAKIRSFVKQYILKYITRREDYQKQKAAKASKAANGGKPSEDKPSASPATELQADLLNAHLSPLADVDFTPDTPAISTNTTSAPRSVQSGEGAHQVAYAVAAFTPGKRALSEDEDDTPASQKRARSDSAPPTPGLPGQTDGAGSCSQSPAPSASPKKRRADDSDQTPESPKRMRSMDDIEMADSDENPPATMAVDSGVSVC